MRTNDQYFQPGDKVMRVAEARYLFKGMGYTIEPHHPDTDWGKVVCVACCFRDSKGNMRVQFCGIPSRGGYFAACFRKVEEIKLCVRAAEKMREPVQTELETQPL